MRFGVLGPLTVHDGERVRPVAGARQRVLLAALVVRAGQALSADALAEVVWDGSPPPGAVATLRTHVMRLRRVLGPAAGARLLSRPPGYLVQASEDEVDLLQFDALCRAGGTAVRAGEWARAWETLEQALALWRGPALADAGSQILHRDEVPRLEERRLQALEWRIEAGLGLERHGELVAELGVLAARYPLRERFQAQLMLALYRCGRQAEALAHYQQAREVLAGELGVEPGPALRDLHQRVLAADPGLGAAAASVAPAPAGDGSGPVPRQLPGVARFFVGRRAELEVLSALADEAGGGGGALVCAIGGMAGVGKTALAVRWAHEVAARFPDGQLYVNLRGFDPSQAPVSAGEAIRGFLDGLGVPAERVPASVEAQAGLYRSLTAGRRLLILLDNAGDEEQVRPLLPAGPGCLVVVTSRRQLMGLVTRDGAWPLSLDALSEAEARELLASRLGPERVGTEPAAVGELVALCGRLPLALAITAARAATTQVLGLADLAAELRDEQGRLEALDSGEMSSSVRAVFSWSYQQLSMPAARLFRLAGLHPGPDITGAAAAALAGLPPAQARRLLRDLASAHLLTEHTPGRFGLHDLLRAYASQQAHIIDSPPERHAALHRVLDYYLHSAHTAVSLLDPARLPVGLAPPRPGSSPEGFASHQEALAWCRAEHRVLLAVVAAAARTGFDDHAWQLPCALTSYFYQQGHWQDWIATQQAALAAAERCGNLGGQARARLNLGAARAKTGWYRDADAYLQQALALYERAGDPAGLAQTHHALAVALGRQGRYQEALGHAKRILEFSRRAGLASGEATGLRVIGWNYARLGNQLAALSHCQQALPVYRRLADRHGEALTWDCLGYAHHYAGHYQHAVTCYETAVSIYRELDGRYDRADALSHLGDTYSVLGNPDKAREAWQQALVILDELHHPDALRVRGRVRGLEAAGTPDVIGRCPLAAAAGAPLATARGTL